MGFLIGNYLYVLNHVTPSKIKVFLIIEDLQFIIYFGILRYRIELAYMVK